MFSSPGLSLGIPMQPDGAGVDDALRAALIRRFQQIPCAVHVRVDRDPRGVSTRAGNRPPHEKQARSLRWHGQASRDLADHPLTRSTVKLSELTCRAA